MISDIMAEYKANRIKKDKIRKSYIKTELMKEFQLGFLNHTQLDAVAEFITNTCFCDNCEHNAPDYPWGDKE